jgi:membrane fusion protein (multidrug efflux system)
MIAVTAVFFAAVFGWKAFSGYQTGMSMQNMQLPPVTVSTATVTASSWMPEIAAVGSLRAQRGVDVTAQAAGQIVALHFDSGDAVAAGDLLVQQYTADDQARLEGLVAARELAERNLARAEDLRAKKLISELDFDSRGTELRVARAVESELGLSIEKRAVRAPFSGRLGIRQVDIGQYIEPGDAIARLEAQDVIYLDFPVPQRRFGALSLGQSVAVHVDAWPEQRFEGVVSAIEPQVERATRNVRVRAEIDNRDGRLVPGMFARIDVQLPTQQNVLTVPQSAIVYSPYGDAVYVVEEGQQPDAEGALTLTAVNTFVVTGPTRGDQIAIESGLQADMTVVTAGQQKLRNGSRVVINNSVPVGNDPNPTPENN